jgi:K+:H+ antiporter
MRSIVLSLAREYIGVHAILGAFLFGAVIPHDSAVAREFTHKLEDLVTVLLLPAFFAFTGLRTHIGLLAGCKPAFGCRHSAIGQAESREPRAGSRNIFALFGSVD